MPLSRYVSTGGDSIPSGRSTTSMLFTASASQGIKIVNRDDIDHTFTIPQTQIDMPVVAGETLNGEPIAGAVEPGTYDFMCAIHHQMTGRVTVVA